ncbi:MAG TPA: DNA mismatch repair protein MutS, partial [Isosphaeraceae bacterium]|nr:DNA mismatch repair protein MutS [Isosphaeraceae bacterium]
PPDFPPRAEYARRLAAHREAAARLERPLRRLANARIAVFLAGLVGLWLVLERHQLMPIWLVVPIVGFVALVVLHARLDGRRRRSEHAATYFEKALARLDGEWSGHGDPGTAFLDPEHPYAADLDLFGTGSLFERICQARTNGGRATLAGWLLAPGEPEVLRDRQGAVADLRDRLDLREDLALLGEDLPEGADLAGLVAWGNAPARPFPIWARLVAPVLGVYALGALVAWFALDIGSGPFLLGLVLDAAFFALWRRRVLDVLKPLERRADDLAVFADLLARIEREPFHAPRLVALRGALETGGAPPSRQIDQLRRLAAMLASRRNQVFMPFAPLLLWGTQIAFAAEAWRARSGRSIGAWLDCVGECEALASLATFAFEGPDDPFPEVGAPGPRFEAEGLGHPLIPADRCVRNDVRLADDLRLLVVSGSNMAGKSTLLRSVGVNAVLAQAGATVRASRLVISPLAVGATLRVQDSLQSGQSRFYAEIRRIRQLVDLAGGPIPLFFLLDEVFAGTNSHDRRVGAEAVVLALIDRGAIGLVTTHDLALAAVVDRLAPRASNVHFVDHLEDGVLRFDYRMHPGVVRHGNALALMRAIGLSVPEEGDSTADDADFAEE